MQHIASHAFSTLSANVQIANPNEHKENIVELSGKSIQKGVAPLVSGKQFQSTTSTLTSSTSNNQENIVKRKPLGDLSNTKKTEKVLAPIGKISKKAVHHNGIPKKNQATTKTSLTVKTPKPKGISKLQSQTQPVKKPLLKNTRRKKITVTNIPNEIDYMPPSAVDIPEKDEPHLFTNLDFTKLLGKPYIPSFSMDSSNSLEIPKKLEFEKIPDFDDVLVDDWKPENTLNLLSEFDVDAIDIKDL